MPTKRERLEKKLKLLFADRHVELNVFRRFIGGADDYGLLHVMGIPGIGKTALLRAFGAICDDENVPWVLANVGDQELPAQVLRFIYDQLTRTARVALPQLQAQLARHEELDRKVRTDEHIPPEVLSVILTGMSGPVGENEKDTGQGAEQALSYLSRVLGGADADFYLNPASDFTQALLADLAGLAGEQRICLMFDRYERISSYLDSWIRSELFPNLEKNVFVVTSGRKTLPNDWQEWLPIVRVLELEPLTNEDTQTLVRLRGVTVENAVREIADFAGGLPLAASIAADVLRESGATRLGLEGIAEHLTIVGQLVHKLTEEVPADLREWLEQCAIVRWFNEDTLEQFVGIPGERVAEAYARLGRLSFVQPHPDGLALHDLVRDFICEDLVKRSRRRYIELHRKAANYYEQLIAGAQRREAQPWAVELVYHLLRADENEGISRLRELFDNATDFSQAEFSAALLDTTRELEIQGNNKLWLDYFEGVLWQQKNVDNLKSARLLEALISRPEVEQHPELKARSAAYLSVALWYIAEFPSALRYAEMGLELSRRLDLPKFVNRALEVLGLTFNRLGRFGEGIDAQLKLLELTRQSNDRMGEAWALNNLGYFSWHAGKWTQAEDYLLKCRALMLDLRSPYNVVYPLCHLGLLYIAVGRLDDAERILLESLRICEEERNLEINCKTLQNLTDLRRVQGRFEEALEHIDRALEISHTMVHPFYDTDSLRRRGDVLRAMGRLDEAATEYIAGLDLARRLKVEYLEMRILAALKMLQLSGWDGTLPREVEHVPEVCLKMGYHHILSDFKFAQAVASFEGGKVTEGQQSFLEALIYGMLYNRYWLYNKLTEIINLTKEWQAAGRGEQGRQLLEDLANLWETETYDGQPLRKIEEAARANEPGLVLLPPPLVVQFRMNAESLSKGISK